MYNKLKYLACDACLEDGDPITSDLSIAVSPGGDLIIECRIHGCLVEFFANGEVAQKLQEIAVSPCDGQEHQEHQEKGH